METLSERNNLTGCSLIDDMVIALSALQNIKILTLEANRITDIGAKALSTMRGLRQLSLGGNRITNEGAKYFTKTNLVHLDLYANELTNGVEDIFLSNKTLTFLGIDFNDKIDESIPIIPQNANFRRPSCGESDMI